MTETTTREERSRSDATYDAAALQEKWLPVWDELAPFRRGRPDDQRPKQYVLDMFPYPSGDLHMGHAEAYALGDVIARYWVQRGYNVLHPIGWDSFGLPAENAAIKRGPDPRRGPTRTSRSRRRRCAATPARSTGTGCCNTCDPEYYRWNQWLFLRFFERGPGLPQGQSTVNWCPQRPDGAGQRAGRRRAAASAATRRSPRRS